MRLLNLEIKGPIVPMLTPFDEYGNIDLETLEFFVDWLIDQKVSVIFPIGGSGERITLSFNEKKLIIKKVLERVNKRILVWPGTGGTSLKETLELSEYALSYDADAVVIVIPKELNPSEEELFFYFKEIDRCLRKPFLIYEPGGYEPYSITPKLFKKLLELQNFIGMKDSSNNMIKIVKNSMEIKDKDIHIIQGNEILYLSSLPLGIRAVIGGGCNIYPQLIMDIYNEFSNKNIDKARKLQWEVIRKWNILEKGWPLSGKIVLAMKGISFKPICRIKVQELTQEDFEILKNSF